jgi:osmotically-inducible protein OsmY
VYPQEPSRSPPEVAEDESSSPVRPDEVKVESSPADAKIAERLTNILRATQWFQDLDTTVIHGVAFLRGKTASSDHKRWALDIALRTEGVVAAIDRTRSPRS